MINPMSFRLAVLAVAGTMNLLAAFPGMAQEAAASRVLWYAQPANPKQWQSESLPIGNGRLGASFFDGVEEDHIQLNEQSLWSGDNNWDGGFRLATTVLAPIATLAISW